MSVKHLVSYYLRPEPDGERLSGDLIMNRTWCFVAANGMNSTPSVAAVTCKRCLAMAGRFPKALAAGWIVA
jgi:hypothetical protein